MICPDPCPEVAAVITSAAFILSLLHPDSGRIATMNDYPEEVDPSRCVPEWVLAGVDCQLRSTFKDLRATSAHFPIRREHTDQDHPR